MNTASASLLSHVAGIGPTLASRIVAHREAHGMFPSRAALTEVKGIGKRTSERVIVELRDKLAKGAPVREAGGGQRADAILALC